MELREHRIKRLRMRSMRRGIKEMDLILSAFADARLDEMDDAALEQYDALLAENDQDLYQWVSNQANPPTEFSDLLAEIQKQFQSSSGG
ncbi:MAG: succinate dehydrogenase assembly factor 2 [Pseudomonadota bacterium]